jgi:hypothetical protein
MKKIVETEMKIGDEIDYEKMCSGSEMLGIRIDKPNFDIAITESAYEEGKILRCKKCHQEVPTNFEINLVPVHEMPARKET